MPRRIARERGRTNEDTSQMITANAKNSTHRHVANKPKNETRSSSDPCTPVVGGAELDPGVPVITATTAMMISASKSRLSEAGVNRLTPSSPIAHRGCRSVGRSQMSTSTRIKKV